METIEIGKVVDVLPLRSGTSQKTGNQWKSLTFVLQTQDTYPRLIPADLINARVDEYQQLIKQDAVLKVWLDIDARRYEDPETHAVKYFPSIKCYRLENYIPVQQEQPEEQHPGIMMMGAMYGTPAQQQPAPQSIDELFPDGPF